MTARIEIWGIEGIPEIESGDDLGQLLVAAGTELCDGDIIVVTSKVVSKAEGRLVPGTREEHLAAESVRLVARRGDTQIVETSHGFVLAAAGIDASNVPAGTVALLPLDPDASARKIYDTLRAELGVEVAVIISDTMGRPWRDGVIDTAIGAAGLDVLWDLRGQRDTAGHLLEATVIAIADELASAADLVKGKLAATPVAVIRGFPASRSDPDPGARPLVRRSADDMFRLGTREAMHSVVVNSAPVSVSGDVNARTEERVNGGTHVALVRLAVDAVVSDRVSLLVSSDGGTVTASGDPLLVGIALGRLLAALAAEGLRASVQVAPEGATAAVHVVS
jgi:coenzyme F420-0:L-glutamate ligase / coenzyme F420-1:gamma-L-glutamate ligase